MRYPIAIALVAIGLAGCNASPKKTESPATDTAESAAPKADAAATPAATELVRYSCADGSTVEARYPTPTRRRSSPTARRWT